MKKLLLIALIVGVATVVSAQQVTRWWVTQLPPAPPRPVQQTFEPEPYPGWNSHSEPPADFFCRQQSHDLSVDPAHVCNCERGCDETGVLHEDKKCTVYCHMDHCHCPIAHKDLCPVPDPAQ